MEVNIAPVCRYKFLLKEPVLYIRPISLSENIATNVKFLTIPHNKAYNNYTVYLYGEDKNVNWEDAMTSKYGFIKIRCNDIFSLGIVTLNGF